MDATILSVGREPELLSLRSLVLRSAGFRVLEATDPGLAAQVAGGREVDMVLFCHSISGAECQQVMASVEPKDVLFAFVVNSAYQKVPLGATGVPNTGEEFVKGIEALLHRSVSKAAPDSAPKACLPLDCSLRIA